MKLLSCSQWISIAMDGVTLPFLEGATLDNGTSSTKGEDVIDPPANSEIFE